MLIVDGLVEDHFFLCRLQGGCYLVDELLFVEIELFLEDFDEDVFCNICFFPPWFLFYKIVILGSLEFTID